MWGLALLAARSSRGERNIATALTHIESRVCGMAVDINWAHFPKRPRLRNK